VKGSLFRGGKGRATSWPEEGKKKEGEGAQGHRKGIRRIDSLIAPEDEVPLERESKMRTYS